MFGASEDRARQLAGRQRWKRISSNGSNSSDRSASSLSQLSHCETSSVFEQNIQRPTPIPEHHAYTANSPRGDQHDSGGLQQFAQSAAVSGVEEALSQIMAKNQHSRMQQQRSQAEHLSQVLYNDAAINNILLPSSSHPVLPSETKQYGVLGWGVKVLHQVRHATAPTPQAYAADHQSTHDVANRSVTTDIMRTQKIASMRGGASDSWPKFWQMARQHEVWGHAFNTGIMYRSFVDSLSPVKASLVSDLFGERGDMGPSFNLSRQLFYRDLESDEQAIFRRMIIERARNLLGSTLYGRAQSPDELHRIMASSTNGDGYPPVYLEHLGVALLPLQDPLAGSALR